MLLSQTVFWLAIASMVITSLALAAVLTAPSGKRPRWMILFLFHIGAYGIWLGIQSWVFFHINLMGNSPEGFALPVSLIHYLLSLVILLSYLPFILQLIGGEEQKRIRISFFSLQILLVLITFTGFFFHSLAFGMVINALFNSYFLLLSGYGLLKLKKQQLSQLRRAMYRFLLVAVILYGLLLLALPVALLIPLERFPSFSLLFTALFCGSWSLLMVRQFMARSDTELRPVTIHQGFLSDYKISAREREVLEKVIQGKSNKKIADELFISTRTVETHIYKIYRKCGVSNKVELLRLLEST